MKNFRAFIVALTLACCSHVLLPICKAAVSDLEVMSYTQGIGENRHDYVF